MNTLKFYSFEINEKKQQPLNTEIILFFVTTIQS